MGWWRQITNMWVCSEREMIDDTWYVRHARSALTSAQTSRSTISQLLLQWIHFCMPSQESMPHSSLPLPHPIFHYLFHFLHHLIPLSVHALHHIRKCFTSSTSSLSHSVHFLSFLFKPLCLPTSIRSTALLYPPPPPPRFVSILLLISFSSLPHF